MRLPLRVAPALASWDRGGSPSQARLAGFLQHVRSVIQPAVRPEGPLAFDLDIGLPEGVDLLDGHDLDNYLEGPVRRVLPGRVVFASATKRHAPASSVRVALRAPAEPRALRAWAFASARPRGSYTCSDWKAQIEAAVANQAQLAPDGPLEMQVAFRIGPRRNWVNLWKPALDALTPILGPSEPCRAFHPRDDRIVRLAFHLAVDPDLRDGVEIGYWWCPALRLPTGDRESTRDPRGDE